MSDPYELAHSLAKAVHPFNHLVVAATDQAYLIGRLQDEVKQLRSQRDEARREICNSKKRGLTTHLDYARKRGWDCFKETL